MFTDVSETLVAQMVEAASFSEMSVNFYQITRLNNTEDKSSSAQKLLFHFPCFVSVILQTYRPTEIVYLTR
jgi:hypothetical protein